jgi:DNA-binding beta-propeller fold protein YncE
VSPAVVAVTKAGALVLLDSATGSVARTLVPDGVLGDEISVSPDGTTVYFAQAHGCSTDVESVPVTGGSPTVITSGSLPAVSPDGTKLAIFREPPVRMGCAQPGPNLMMSKYKVVVRTLSSGSQVTYPMLAAGKSSGLPFPVSHLSWAPDGIRLAVSILSPEDNEGWNLVIMNTATAQYYLSGPGDTYVPPTGHPSARKSYLREGVFMPNGDLFVSRACCAGVPVRNTSRLMWEVNTSGTLVHQVAIGFASLDHTSLDVNATGRWLLYLAGDILYVSHDGNTPRQLATGLIAAAWQ